MNLQKFGKQFFSPSCKFRKTMKVKFMRRSQDISSHQNKKAVSPFYQKKIFLIENKCTPPMGVLHSFSIKNIFYDKMDLRLFYFDEAI